MSSIKKARKLYGEGFLSRHPIKTLAQNRYICGRFQQRDRPLYQHTPWHRSTARVKNGFCRQKYLMLPEARVRGSDITH